MLKKVVKVITFILISLVAVALLVALLPQLVTRIYTLPRLYSVASVPASPVAIVFGAGLRRDGTPSPVLRDRIDTAVELYTTGKVQKLLMSGDNRFIEHNEPGSMREYAISRGIPDSCLIDYEWERACDDYLAPNTGPLFVSRSLRSGEREAGEIDQLRSSFNFVGCANDLWCVQSCRAPVWSRETSGVGDFTGDNLGLEIFDLSLEISRHRAVQVVVGCNPHTAVGHVADIIGAALEGSFGYILDHCCSRDVHDLHHTGQDNILRGGL